MAWYLLVPFGHLSPISEQIEAGEGLCVQEGPSWYGVPPLLLQGFEQHLAVNLKDFAAAPKPWEE